MDAKEKYKAPEKPYTQNQEIEAIASFAISTILPRALKRMEGHVFQVTTEMELAAFRVSCDKQDTNCSPDKLFSDVPLDPEEDGYRFDREAEEDEEEEEDL